MTDHTSFTIDTLDHSINCTFCVVTIKDVFYPHVESIFAEAPGDTLAIIMGPPEGNQNIIEFREISLQIVYPITNRPDDIFEVTALQDTGTCYLCSSEIEEGIIHYGVEKDTAEVNTVDTFTVSGSDSSNIIVCKDCFTELQTIYQKSKQVFSHKIMATRV